jgi:hypothetical protein
VNRGLPWEGCFNARDLGGIRTRDGARVRPGAIVRADALDELTADGWRAVEEHGVRTIIDLRNDDERNVDPAKRPETIATMSIPIDHIDDVEFWAPWRSGWQFGTPLFYAAHVARFPEATASVIGAIARAPSGGVVVHCAAGRDRTGLVTLLVLMLLDADEDDIVADYLASRESLHALSTKRDEPDPGVKIDQFLAGRGTSLERVVRDALREIDREAWRRAGGITNEVLAALRARLLA